MHELRGRMFAVLSLVSLSVSAQAPGAGAAPGLTAAFRENSAWVEKDGLLTYSGTTPSKPLHTRAWLGDVVIALKYRSTGNATLFVMGRYAVPLPATTEFRDVRVRLRAPRYDAGFNKVQNALLLEAQAGAAPLRNVVFAGFSPDAPEDDENSRAPSALVVQSGTFTIQSFRIENADYEQVNLPAASGGNTNEKELVDFVALGRETFTAVGCEACHQVEANSTAVSSGPNLFGLFRREPRTREVVEGGEGHRFQIKASREYLHTSVRDPAHQIAVTESGEKRGEAYLPVMPPFAKEILSDLQIDAIGAYLATLNDTWQSGPVESLQPKQAAALYDPFTDSLQFLVGDRVRLQRGPLPGTSARAIHVGLTNGINYSFDPRVFSIVKIWKGGFLDMTGELTNRGGRGLALGFDSRDVPFGEREYLLAPLAASGGAIDFTFKEAKFGDQAAIRASLDSPEDHLARLAKIDAQFLGYSRDSKSAQAAPVFRYRVGKNTIEVRTDFDATGVVNTTVTGNFATEQVFKFNMDLLRDARATAGWIKADRWTLGPGKVNASLSAKVPQAANPAHASSFKAPANYNHARQQLVTAAAKAELPAGYAIENYYAPKDNYGREQLFEALGLARASDGTVVVATRNAGIWRLVKGEWRLFAEGLFDSLGVVVEDSHGLTVVAGHKAEITRISDTNGDGMADRYETLFDAHSYHGNYHTYMHGPVKGGDGKYYFALNLAHENGPTMYRGGSQTMGTYGGYNGWAFQVTDRANYKPFANGLRSPASIGTGPDGRVWYTDNQGDFVGTSKLYVLEEGGFYGHPAGLVDLPGMVPTSPEIQWDQVKQRKKQPAILFPHNRVANSPGNPAWDLTKGKFGPFAGQMLIGDQTQSNLLRVQVEEVRGKLQGSVMPFMAGLESGVMRPLFLADGSLLLGQTGRGWQAKGGKVAALQHVRWDGKTIAPAIGSVSATASGFDITFTQPLAARVTSAELAAALKLESWVYRDAPDYGSPELGLAVESVESVTVSPDRKRVTLALKTLSHPSAHPMQTARVYHARLEAGGLFDGAAPAALEAYYTSYGFR
jgi:cytochrome c553